MYSFLVKKQKTSTFFHCFYVEQENYWLPILTVVWFGFYGISTIIDYLMPNPLYTYLLNIYDLVWLGFMAYQSF